MNVAKECLPVILTIRQNFVLTALLTYPRTFVMLRVVVRVDFHTSGVFFRDRLVKNKRCGYM